MDVEGTVSENLQIARIGAYGGKNAKYVASFDVQRNMVLTGKVGWR